MLLLTRITRLLTHNPKKIWSEAQPIFKDYYSRRLTLTPHQLEQFLLKLSSKQFSEADHRWTSLLQNIEINLHKYHPQSRVYMLKALAGMRSKSELVGKILQDLMGEVNSLGFQESAVLLWCLSKCGGSTRIDDVTKVYTHLCDILAKYQEEDGTVRIVISKQDGQNFQKKTLALRATSICMVLSAMGKLKISEKTILKHLLKGGVRPNIPAFSSNGLVSILISLQKLGFRNKRDFLNICQQLKKRSKDLEVEQLETLENLAHAVSNLLISKHFEELETDGRQKPQETILKIREIRSQMNTFLLWLCETIQLRYKTLDKQKAAKILHFCGKAEAFHPEIWSKSLKVLCQNVEDCKMIDLVMALKALTNLSEEQRKSFSNQQLLISKRLWVLHSSISGQSLSVLARLFEQKKINPPPRIVQIINEFIAKRKNTSQREEEGQNEEENKENEKY